MKQVGKVSDNNIFFNETYATEKFTVGAKKQSYSRKEREPLNSSFGIICDANILNKTTDHFPSLILFDDR